MKIALTIAGSDSGGGAGIQADLKTFQQFGVFGTSVIVALTAQNTRGVRAVETVSEAMVAAQLAALAEDLPPAALKTGMLADVTRASNGLRVVWIPTTPFAKRSPELEKAYGDLLAANPQVQLGSSVIPPRTPWCGSLAACPGWAEWLDLVLAQLG